MCSSALLKCAIPVLCHARGELPERSYSELYLCPTGLEACGGGPLLNVVESIPKQTIPCPNECLTANPNRASLVCNMPYPGVGCRAYWKGTMEVSFGLFSTRALECSQSEPTWHGSAWHGTARCGTVCFKKRLNAVLEIHSQFSLKTSKDHITFSWLNA